MKKPGFSRRDFVSAGSLLAASAVVSDGFLPERRQQKEKAEGC